MGGGRLQEVVAHGGSTVHAFQWYTYIVCNTSLLLYFISKTTNHDIGLLLLCLLFVPVCQYSVNSFSKADHLIPAALWIGDPVREQTVQDRFPIIKITVMINITGQILLNLTIKLHEMLTHGKLKYTGHLTGCGGADPHNWPTSASSASWGHFSAQY